MDRNAVETEILKLEKQYWQSMKEKDAETAAKLTDYPCIVAGAQGVAAVDERAFASMLTGSDWKIEDFSLGDDAQVRLIADNVAIVAYKVRETLTVENKPVTLDAADASVWVKRDGGWRCALHTESLAGDPYGRDRKPAH